MSDIRAMVFSGKAEHLLSGLPENSVDSVVTDPPYGLAPLKTATVTKAITEWVTGDRWFVPDGRGFMSTEWDRFVPPPGIWDACFRVLKPGGRLLAFAAPRTADLMGLSIRLAGFEVLDSVHWFAGQGFPKAKSQLKPAHEPIIMAWKPAKTSPPLPGIDGCRVGTTRDVPASLSTRPNDGSTYGKFTSGVPGDLDPNVGRWPPNLLLTHDARCEPAGTVLVKGDARAGQEAGTRPGGFVNTGSGNGDGHPAGAMHGNQEIAVYACVPGCPVAVLDAQSGSLTSGTGAVKRASARGGRRSESIGAESRAEGTEIFCYGDTGGASRFFPQLNWDPAADDLFRYCAKAPAAERAKIDGRGHPTVKPLSVIRWIARLVTPSGGLILDPFGGTMTTVQAALAEGFRCVAADDWDFAIELARVRLAGLEGVVFA